MKETFFLLNKKTEIEWTSEIRFENVEPNDVAIIDIKVWKLYQDKLEKQFSKEQVYLFSAMEEHKSMSELVKFFAWLSHKRFSRSDTIWGIGGGITTDFAGFAASVYKRGCRLKLIPTTLLAMIDAAIGGKTALNFNSLKNGIGSFYPAEKIFISPDWLRQLPAIEMKNGLIEIIKTSLLQPTDLYSQILETNSAVNTEMLMKTVQIKMQLCVSDPEDKNVRRFLNLGHTFAHVLETASQYQLSHGKCVLKGIKAAVLFSLRTRFITPDVADKILLPFQKLQLDFIPNEKIEINPQLFFQDKKATNEINLILFKGFQSLFIHPTTKIHLLKDVLDEVLYSSL